MQIRLCPRTKRGWHNKIHQCVQHFSIQCQTSFRCNQSLNVIIQQFNSLFILLIRMSHNSFFSDSDKSSIDQFNQLIKKHKSRNVPASTTYPDSSRMGSQFVEPIRQVKVIIYRLILDLQYRQNVISIIN